MKGRVIYNLWGIRTHIFVRLHNTLPFELIGLAVSSVRKIEHKKEEPQNIAAITWLSRLINRWNYTQEPNLHRCPQLWLVFFKSNYGIRHFWCSWHKKKPSTSKQSSSYPHCTVKQRATDYQRN